MFDNLRNEQYYTNYTTLHRQTPLTGLPVGAAQAAHHGQQPAHLGHREAAAPPHHHLGALHNTQYANVLLQLILNLFS